MKLNLNNLKAVAINVFLQTKRMFASANDFRKENKGSKKLVVLTLIIALLMPVFLFGSLVKKADAKQAKLSSSINQPQLLIDESPVPFFYSPSDTVSAKFASTILTLNTNLANGFVSTVNLFKTPQLPEGFETAQPVSPAKAVLLSVGDSIKSFFGNSSSTSNVILAPPPVPAGSTSFDFDGDGKADVARFRSSTGDWEIKYSNNTTASGILAAGKLAPADYDGDGKTDLASFNNGTWNIRQSSNGQIVQINNFGQSGDIPVSGNYTGSFAIDLAVYRPSNGTWYIKEAVSGTVTSTQFGAAGDIAASGNYDGDGVMDFAVFRPSNGYWYILGSTSGFYTFAWGVATDIPVPSDYDGDGKTDCAVYRASSGAWYAAKSSVAGQYIADTWGNYGDQPAPADYDNDGKADFAVYRPMTGVWHTKKSNGGTYEFTALGTPQDTAVSSAYIKQVGGQVATYDMAKTRLSPKNSTGGTDLYSRNFGWSSGLVGLSGRAGLGMGFGISYNSLVWTKHINPTTNTSTMYFDVDNSNVSPGFRFGFPTIEPVYYDSQTEKFSYLMVSPSGARTEFKQIGASDVYETVDSSYVQLKTKGADSANDPVENIRITVIGTDGTKMSYGWKGGAFRASEVKDRNGNFITINHDNYGLLQSVTDTLGRIVTVDYDSQLYPMAIKQTWKDNNGQGSNITHYWARFEYTTININPSFNSSLGVFGPTGGAPIKALNKIKRADDSYTVFEYQSNGFGQVSKIRNFAADNHELNYVQTNLASAETNLTDCPRLSQTKSWAENSNNNQEVTVNNTLTNNQSYSLPDGHSGTAAKIEVTMANHPHGAVSKTFVGESGWMEALPIATEDWANGTSSLERKRWTWTQWTQDNPNLSYILNPRSTESKVGDTANIKRTTVEYLMQLGSNKISQYGLTTAVNVYDADQSTILKRAETDYNLNSAYVSRRIIGLPSETRAYGMENSALTFGAKASFAYDEEDFAQENNQNISTVIQHDNVSFSASFIIGRGNLTSTTRHDILGQTSSVTSKVRYDIAGSVVAQLDPLNRKVRVEYTDAFNDTTTSRNTFAYPTKVFDTAGKFSKVTHRFDTGANVWAKSPDLTGNIDGPGKETTRLYDAIGRLKKETLVNTGAYTRYEYPTNAIQSKVFSTVIDVNGNGADITDEVYSESWSDGAGRTLRSRTEHPDSTGGWTGILVEYNILGQVKRSTVPTEITSSYVPAGDDAIRGWLWTGAEYDWKGRTTRSINTDGTDTLVNYEGCGCAGGQVTTIQSELIPRDDYPNQTARRTQKIYEDILGRTYKTEVMNWDGVTPYTTTVQTFNRRDQILKTRQYSGTTSSSAFQDVTMTYDGHGRMKTRRFPVEDANTDTTWIYNTDDSIQQIIDPRNAITNFSYNLRGLVDQISYDQPANQTLIPDTPNVYFTYDALGNRTKMTDGSGTQNYNYDELSRLTSETKIFAGLTGNFTIAYSYHIGGGLKSVTDPFNSTVNYTNDKTGRVTAAVGTAWAENITGNYVSNIKYRAFGQIKQMDYNLPSETPQIKLDYNSRLSVSHFETTSANQQSGYLMKSDFTYSADNRTQAKNDLLNDSLDRSMDYDFAGRLVFNQFGMATGNDNLPKRVYEQSIQYDAFSQMTSRGVNYWSHGDGFTATYVNGRKQDNTLTFDAAGNITGETENVNEFQRMTFDAAGRKTGYLSRWRTPFGQQTTHLVREDKTEEVFDGDGRPVIEKIGVRLVNQTPEPPMIVAPKLYQVWSTVLGASLTSTTPDGAKSETKIFAGGAVIAKEKRFVANNRNYDSVEWRTADPVTGTTAVFGYATGQYFTNIEEIEPFGQKVATADPEYFEPTVETGSTTFSAGEPEWQCQVSKEFYGGFSGMPEHCQMKALKAAGDKLPWEDEIRESPHNIPSAPSGSGGAIHTAGDRIVNLTATKKTEDGDSPKGSPVDPSQIPNDSGTNFEQQYEGSNVSFGTGAGVAVEVRDLDVPDDFIDASRSGLSVESNISLSFVGQKEALSSCVAQLFQEFFSEYNVNGVKVNIPNDAQFIKGIPFVPRTFSTITPNAVTYGLYHIYYDSLDVNSPTWDNLGTIAEEISHGEQFIKMWISMPNVTHDGEFRLPKPRRPTYGEAQTQWKVNYLTGAINAYLNGFETYDNEIEKEAKVKRNVILNGIIAKHPNAGQKGVKLCP